MQIEESLEKILRHKEIVVREFYKLFLDRHPEVREFFDGVNLDHQAAKLTMALVMVECHHSHQYPATVHYLRVLGHRHHDMGIVPALFPKFRDSLLESLEGFHGDEWDADLGAQWREAIDGAVETMLEGYQRAYTY